MSFKNIIGHDQTKKLLNNALSEGRLAHAYLFHGPTGVGKKSLTKALAMNIFCSNRNMDACGTCPSCNKVDQNKHPDFFVVEPSGNNIKIDQIREVQKKAQYKPYEGEKKVFLITHAEKMTRDASNCLLKILEEPPLDTVFLITANNLYSLMPTIISRCQAIQLGKAPLDKIESLLCDRQVEPSKARLFASLSDGLPGVALEMAETDKGLENRELVFLLEDNIKKGDINELFKLAEELEKKKELPELLEQMLLWYRDRLVWNQTGEENLVLNMDKIDLLKKEPGDKYKLIFDINSILEARNQVNQNVNARLIVEVLLLRLAGLSA